MPDDARQVSLSQALPEGATRVQDSSPRGTAGDTARRELRVVDEQRPCREHARSRSCGMRRKRVRDPSAGTAWRDARGRDGDWELRGKGRAASESGDWEYARGGRHAGAEHRAAQGPGLLPRSSRCLPSRGERASAATMR
jgi:hypothetical protein